MFYLVRKKICKNLLGVVLAFTFVIGSMLLNGCKAKASSQVKVETTSVVESASEARSVKSENANGNQLSVLKVPVKEEVIYKGVYIQKTIDEFNALGFEYGDSVNIVFSNGYELKDIPYYSGYYAKPGDPLLVAYPGYEYIDACICYGESMWALSRLKDGDTADIVLNEKGKYKNLQDFFSVQYSDNRDDYSSDEEFANFRCVEMGNLKHKILYRGTSPIDNKHNRAKYANDLIKQANIKYIVDLTDTEELLNKYFREKNFASNYFKELYENGKVSVTHMTANYKTKEFAKLVVKALTDMSKNEGPYYIHCVEGKDRTGFVLAVIEGLAGASYEDIVKDYMVTYENYYGITELKDKEKYDAYVKNRIDDILGYISKSDSSGGTVGLALNEIDWVNVMGRYLMDNGMSMEDMDNFYKNLMRDSFSDPD